MGLYIPETLTFSKLLPMKLPMQLQCTFQGIYLNLYVQWWVLSPAISIHFPGATLALFGKELLQQMKKMVALTNAS